MITRSLVGLRVTEQEEQTDGLDFGSHGESGYRL
jgi:ammonia channel protein AmtB